MCTVRGLICCLNLYLWDISIAYMFGKHITVTIVAVYSALSVNFLYKQNTWMTSYIWHSDQYTTQNIVEYCIPQCNAINFVFLFQCVVWIFNFFFCDTLFDWTAKCENFFSLNWPFAEIKMLRILQQYSIQLFGFLSCNNRNNIFKNQNNK